MFFQINIQKDKNSTGRPRTTWWHLKCSQSVNEIQIVSINFSGPITPQDTTFRVNRPNLCWLLIWLSTHFSFLENFMNECSFWRKLCTGKGLRDQQDMVLCQVTLRLKDWPEEHLQRHGASQWANYHALRPFQLLRNFLRVMFLFAMVVLL